MKTLKYTNIYFFPFIFISKVISLQLKCTNRIFSHQQFLKNIGHFAIKINMHLSSKSTPIYLNKGDGLYSQKDMYVSVHGNIFINDKSHILIF